jgi:hypothetical protein
MAALVAAPARSATTAPGAAPVGGIGIRLVDVPLTGRDDPRARLYIVDHLAPGTTIRRRIELTNTTSAAVRTRVYAAAATIERGAFLGAAGHTRDELSTWTSVRPGRTELRARGHRTATVTIAVPRDAAPGERYAVVWAEARSAPAAGEGITQVSRVGVRIYLSVGPGGAPAANFTVGAIRAKRSSDGRPIVEATVHNTGGRALDISGALRLLAGPGGLTAGPFPANLGTTLAIGDSEPITIVLDTRVPSGPWDARVTMRSGLLERRARASLTFPEKAAPAGRSPALAAIIAILVLAIAAALILRRRRRGRSEPSRGYANSSA